MAQPLFDEHPLQIYLRGVGESEEIMPGGTPEFTLALDCEHPDEADEEWMPPFMVSLLQILRLIVSSTHISAHASPFAERFKFNVISSSLLSSSLSTPHPHHGHNSPHIPGRLSPAHPRVDSPEIHPPPSVASGPPPPSPASPSALEHGWIKTLAFGAILAILTARHYLLAAVSLAGACYYYIYISNVDTTTSKPTMTSSLDTLNDLIAAGNVWDSVVHEAITTLEKEEQSFYGPLTTPSSPSSPLRIALHSSLHTTQTQCDNIRHLFSALTSPPELSQLSEMYAPPSPIKPTFSDIHDTPRPLSLPGSRISTISSPSNDKNKRSTWNGSYSSLAHAGSPTMQVLKRRENRRSKISSLLEVTEAMRSAVSAPVTPSLHSTLSGVQEEVNLPSSSPNTSLLSAAQVIHPESYFAIAALDLQRKRRTGGLEALSLQTPLRSSNPFTISTSSNSGSRYGTPTMSSASRFTTMQTTRHPLSLSALHHALQGACASKRYACSHLLALRFNEEADEGYWEDVRSVVGLLATTLVDASSRLTEALEDAEKERLKDENPTPDSHLSHSRSGSAVEVEREREHHQHHHHSGKTSLAEMMMMMVSFAPMPSHLSRFAVHVDAISSALNDAREQLEQCVASLHDDTSTLGCPSSSSSSRSSRSSSRSSSPVPPPPPPPPPPLPLPLPQTPPSRAALQEMPALRAYERLRRELGLALRECERGRDRLLDVLALTHNHHHHHHHHHLPCNNDNDGSADPDDLPALGHDAGSDESDKPDPTSPFLDGHHHHLHHHHHHHDDNNDDDDNDEDSARVGFAHDDDDDDDATPHLLLTATSQHLPRPGIEQVFEADSGGGGGLFAREKSTLTREERIELVKARRGRGRERRRDDDKDGGLPLGLDIPPVLPSSIERWGPGGEVVQELKDVIWKVGERRRKMADDSQFPGVVVS